MPDSERNIENDVAPARDALSDAERSAIRTRCKEEVARGIPGLVEAAPPVSPKRRRLGQELYAGPLGQAFGFLHLYERTGANEQIELACRYLEVALAALDDSGVPRPEEWLSFHASGGASAVAAVVYDRLGDAASCARHLESYRRLAPHAADPEFPSEDLLWGRGGFFFGAAFLRSLLGESSLPEELVLGPLEATIATGRRHAATHASALTPGRHGRPPLLYMNLNAFMVECFARSLIGSQARSARALAAVAARVLIRGAEWRERLSRRYDIGLVHGLAGNLYLMMHFPELLERLGATEDVRASLDCLVDCVDDERGMLDLLPSSLPKPAHRKKLGAQSAPAHLAGCGGGSRTPADLALRGHEALHGHGRDPPRRVRAPPAAVPGPRIGRVDAPLRAPGRQRDAGSVAADGRPSPTSHRQGFTNESRARSRR
ncbi:MAG: hypothetical protein GY937_06965 [bacterium]|nr:hypothetical protein [bacterium]